NIDLSQPIPPEWRVRGADSHVYRIGLSLFRPLSDHKRSKLHNPVLIFIINMIMLIKCSYAIYVYIYDIKLSDLHFIIIYDLDHFLNTGYTMNLTLIMCTIYSMTLQLINSNNFRNGIKPTDLK